MASAKKNPRGQITQTSKKPSETEPKIQWHISKKNETQRKNMKIRTALNVKELGFDWEIFGCPKCGDVPTLFVHDI